MLYEIDDNAYKVNIVRKNNKNIYIRINSNLEINVTCNKKTSDREILKLLDNNQKALKKMLSRRVKEKEYDVEFYYFGKKYDIIIMSTLDEVDVCEGYIYTPSTRMLDKWLDNQIKVIFLQHYNYWYERFSDSIPYYRLRYRSMKTRWGVCNKKSKTITLNTNLIKYDISCLDYVIVHELAHLIHFNHSKEFWALVEKNYPNYKQAKKLLK